MNEPVIVVTGFRVMQKAKTAKQKPRPISREYTILEAAEQYCSIARRSGIDCYVEQVKGIEE